MPLIACDECGHKISDKAVSCPSCGAPIPAFNLKGSTPTSQAKAPQSPDAALPHISTEGPPPIPSTIETTA
ncbi:MAG: zinc-ribbon domain-containing protein, partial [Xanthobacteraceae bacterium]